MEKRIYFVLSIMMFCLTAIIEQSDAKELVITMGYGKVQVLDVSTDEIVADIPIKGWAREAAQAVDKNFLYVTASRHLIHKIDLQKMTVVETIDMNYGGWQRFIYGISIVEDGKTAYVNFLARKTDAGEVVVDVPTVAQIDLATGKILRSVEVPFGVINLTYAPKLHKLYASGQDIYTIETSGKEMKIVDTYSVFDRGLNILPLFCTTEENGGILLFPYYTAKLPGLMSINANTGEIKELPLKSEMMAYGAVYSTDKKKAYANMDELYVIDLETGTITNTEVIHEGTAFGIVPSTDGKKLYIQSGPIVDVYDTATLRVIKRIQLSTDGWMLNRVTL